MSTNITIRPLTRKDRKTFGQLMVKLVDKTGRKELREMVPSIKNGDGDSDGDIDMASRNAQVLEMAFGLLKGMLDFLDEDVSIWFADLVNEVSDVDEYDELGFSIDLEVVELLLDREDFIDFFSKGSRVFSKIKGFAGRLKS